MLFSTVSITIIDGQNEQIIANQTDSDYNLCIPEPIPFDKRVTITFSSNITSFRDWFPSICTNGSDYDNVYMFDGAQTWTIHNLIVEDYIASDYYYIMRGQSEYADIECIDCRFSNITNDRSTNHLFDTFGSLHFYNSEFEGIVTESNPMISASHSYYDTGITREYSMINCTFTDIVSSWALFYLDYSWNDVEWSICICFPHSVLIDLYLFGLVEFPKSGII